MTYFPTYESAFERDAFQRWRVSSPETLFDSKQVFDNGPLFWDESLESGGGISSAFSAARASTTITSTASTAGKFTRQTFMRHNYQPGKSQLVLMTGVLQKAGGGTGVYRRIGLFDDNDGIFFCDREGTVAVCRRSSVTGSPVDEVVSQADWNIDRLDGTGWSGKTADWSQAQIFVIDFEWLGVGRVRLGLNIDGITFPVHQFVHANRLGSVYMSTPNLPLRYQMDTSASSPASSMECICASVASEGGSQDLGVLRYASTAGTHVDANVDGTIYALLGIRLKAAYLGATVKLVSASFAETAGSNNLEWLLILNPTVAGTFAYADETNSAVQIARGATANTVTGGIVLGGGHFSASTRGGAGSADLQSALRIGAAIDGTRDAMVLAARPVGSINTDVEAGMTWRELL